VDSLRRDGEVPGHSLCSGDDAGRGRLTDEIRFDSGNRLLEREVSDDGWTGRSGRLRDQREHGDRDASEGRDQCRELH
jgi:hypothetical protein